MNKNSTVSTTAKINESAKFGDALHYDKERNVLGRVKKFTMKKDLILAK